MGPILTSLSESPPLSFENALSQTFRHPCLRECERLIKINHVNRTTAKLFPVSRPNQGGSVARQRQNRKSHCMGQCRFPKENLIRDSANSVVGFCCKSGNARPVFGRCHLLFRSEQNIGQSAGKGILPLILQTPTRSPGLLIGDRPPDCDGGYVLPQSACEECP